MSFLGEIKRRKVFRVALLYAAVAWLIVQVVVAIKVPLNLPARTDTLVIVLLVLGFPVALILSWAYDLTSSGLVRDKAHGETAGSLVVTSGPMSLVMEGIRSTAEQTAIIARGHILLWLIGHRSVSNKLEAFNVSVTDLETELRALLSRIPPASAHVAPQPTRSAEKILMRASETLAAKPTMDPALALWQSVAEDTRRLLDNPDEEPSRSNQEWRALIAEVPGLEQATRGDTLYSA